MVLSSDWGFHAPDFIHELDAGEYLARIGQELLQKIEFFPGKGLTFIPGIRSGSRNPGTHLRW